MFLMTPMHACGVLSFLVVGTAASASAPVCAEGDGNACEPAGAQSLLQKTSSIGVKKIASDEHESKRKTIILGQDVNWPPYAYKDETEAGENGGLSGFGKDFGEAAGELCGIDIIFDQTNWKNCWDSEGYQLADPAVNQAASPGIGQGLLNGWYAGCTTYTHLHGVRNRFLEFSDAILNQNKPAGLIVMLNSDGTPKVDGLSNLAGKTVVDVGGWAPTADTIAFVENKCTGEQYASMCTESGGTDCYTLTTGEGNDASMKMLRDGEADAMFIYADQAHNYECDADGKSKNAGAVATWNCSLWANFGTDYAYVQTGQFGHAMNGTTLAMSQRGSGVAEILNPCIQDFLKTKEYYDLCLKHDLVDSCYRNEFFTGTETHHHAYMEATHAHTSGCNSGYCPCPPVEEQDKEEAP